MLTRKIGVLCMFLLMFILANTAYASETTLDIEAELARPGVKLLVVEFYSSSCIPCMKAVPKWKKLHDKYRKNGLRFIVVSADEGLCSKPLEWSPDLSICDTDGVFQRKYEVNELPTSLLFSWEGNIAMRSHRVKSVENAIENYFRQTTYKMEVDQVQVVGDKYAIASNPVWVRDEVVSEVKKLSKFDIISESRSFIPKTHKDVCMNNFPANSNLRIRLTGDMTGERYLSLQLEKDGCIKASAQEPYKGNGFQEDKASLSLAVRLAVKRLLSQVVTVKAIEDAGDAVNVTTFRNNFDDDGSEIKNPIEDKQGYLVVKSEPAGATVFVNGKEMGQTPFIKEMMIGKYVIMVKSGALWIPAKKSVRLTQAGAKLEMKLGPNYGILKVASSPEGAEIWLDGEPTSSVTPFTFPMKKAGQYELSLKKEMYLSKNISFKLGDGKTIELKERLEANFGSISIVSKPDGASIIIDGKDTGKTTPAKISPLAVGGREVVLRLYAHNDFKKLIDVEKNRAEILEANLTGKMGLLKVEAYSELDGKRSPVSGAKVYIDKLEMGLTPFKTRLLMGKHNLIVVSDQGQFMLEIEINEGRELKVADVLTTEKDYTGQTWVDKQRGLMWQVVPPN